MPGNGHWIKFLFADIIVFILLLCHGTEVNQYIAKPLVFYGKQFLITQFVCIFTKKVYIPGYETPMFRDTFFTPKKIKKVHQIICIVLR